MSIMRAFAKGYLGGKIDENTARRERQQIIDDRAAEKTDQIDLMREQATIESDILTKKEEAQTKSMLNSLGLAMGVDPKTWFPKYAPEAMTSAAAASGWYESQANLFEHPEWHRLPLSTGSGTVLDAYQNLRMSSSTIINPEISTNIQKDVVENTDIPTNSSNVLLNDIDSILNPNSKKSANVSSTNNNTIYGKGLVFNQKRNKSKGEFKYHPDFGRIHIYQYEQNAGEKDFGGAFFTDIYNEKEGSAQQVLLNSGILSVLTDSQPSDPTIAIYQGVSKKGDSPILVRGYVENGNYIVTSMPPKVMKEVFGQNQIGESQIPVGFSNNITDTESFVQPFSMPIDQFEARVNNAYSTSYSFMEISDPSKIVSEAEEKLIDLERLFANNFSNQTGLISSKNIQKIPGSDEITVSFLGKDDQERAYNHSRSIFNNFVSKLKDNNYSITDDTREALGITSQSKTFEPYELTTNLGRLVDKWILQETRFNEAKQNPDTNALYTSEEALTKAQRDFTNNITSSEMLVSDYLSKKRTIDEGIEKIDTRAKEENTKIVSKYFPENISPFSDFLKSYITQPDNIEAGITQREQLMTDLQKIADNEEDYKKLLTEAQTLIDTFNLGKDSKSQRQIEKEEKEKRIKSLSIEEWLSEGSVEPKTFENKTEWNAANKSSKEFKSFIGGQGTKYDEDTGFLLFKNPDRPVGDVDPRPKGQGSGSKTPKNWDILYGKTHNNDGTRK